MSKRPSNSLHDIIAAMLAEEGRSTDALDEVTAQHYGQRDRPQYGERLVQSGVLTLDKLHVALARQALVRRKYKDVLTYLKHAAEGARDGVVSQIQDFRDILSGKGGGG